MAAIQGTLTGLAFWFLGPTSPVLWGVVGAVLAVFPFVGTTCVWGPAACLLLFGGHWIKALLLELLGIKWSGREDLNLRPPNPEPGACKSSRCFRARLTVSKADSVASSAVPQMPYAFCVPHDPNENLQATKTTMTSQKNVWPKTGRR